ncbi:hypothetical protein ATI02_3965 [Pseudomonas baetica]|uniref:Uncharacterized protein n=1 Tax=Pseudomonas baetica TaxID=674054 RepID=A0ABX4Q2K7_9PSED|nr:hypothetical protein ATI02_3965 [Pseudomonas baetica]
MMIYSGSQGGQIPHLKNYKTDEPKESLNALCSSCRAQRLCR